MRRPELILPHTAKDEVISVIITLAVSKVSKIIELLG